MLIMKLIYTGCFRTYKSIYKYIRAQISSLYYIEDSQMLIMKLIYNKSAFSLFQQ